MSEMGEESYPLYKVVMLGNLGVGKSTFFIKFRDGVFREDIDDCGLDKSTKLYSRQNGTVAVSHILFTLLKAHNHLFGQFFKYHFL